MKRVNRSALVPYSAKQMFDVVNDVGAYPEFLPWCTQSRVISQDRANMVAEVTVSKAGMRQSFTTKNILVEAESIQMALVDGPFRSLVGGWVFKQLGDDGCKVAMDLSFDINSGIFNRSLATVFNMATDKMVDAFCQRAEFLYD